MMFVFDPAYLKSLKVDGGFQAITDINKICVSLANLFLTGGVKLNILPDTGRGIVKK